MASTEDITEHKRAEEALRESEARFRSLFENATVGIYRTSADGRILMANPTMVRMLRYDSFQELASVNVGSQGYAPGYSRSAFREQVEREGEVKGFESAWQRRDGTVIFVQESARVVRAGDGQVLYYDGIVQDVTERKRAEEALALSEEKFAKAFRSTPVLLSITTLLEGRYVEVNDSFLRLTGYQRNEIIGHTSLDLNFWANPDDRLRMIGALQEQGQIRDQVSNFRMRTGQIRVGQFSAEIIDVGGVQCMVAVIEDITECKRAEEALRESEARFRGVFENAAIGIALVDMQGHPVESNPALQKMLGYNKTELAQMAFTEFTHPDDAQASWDLFTELGEGKRDRYQLEKRYCRKDGQILWGQLTESLVRNQNGEPQYAIGMIEDITARKRAAEALRQLSGRLLRLQDEERRRIARELHDTTAQSLAALAMNLSVVKDSAPDLSPRARTCLCESLELAEECSREIRTLSYLLHPPLLDEAGLGSALRWFIDGYAQRTGIHVGLEMPSELTRLPGEIELALYRVVQEGLTNIHLHSGSKKAHVCLKCRPDQAVLTVADEGRGMPPGVLERGGRRGAKLGVGIPGMRERIRQLGGQFEIVTGSDGTTLTAIVSLGKDQA